MNAGLDTSMKVLMDRIASYDDVDRIRAFVRRTLSEYAPTVASALSGRSSPLVVIKPNWLQESHEELPDVWLPVITHPTLVLATIDCVAELLDGRGTIAVCDAPHTYADMAAITARGDLNHGVADLRKKWPRLELQLLDLRREVWERREGVIVTRTPNPPDPRGYVKFNLGRSSMFFGHPGEGRYYGADYDQSVVNSHHRGEAQEYLLSGTAIAADLFINLPKLKTHKKTGLTCCLKNLVGINGDKNWLPHHTCGSPSNNGDEYPSDGLLGTIETSIKTAGRRVASAVPLLGTWLYRKARKSGIALLGDSTVTVRNGNWHGNDTCWRMTLDLNRALLYGSTSGDLRPIHSRKPYLAIVDGIIGGQGNGPAAPDPAYSGIVVSGDSAASIDAVCAAAMGFDPSLLPVVTGAFADHDLPLASHEINHIRVEKLGESVELALSELEPAIPNGFAPHFGWAGVLRPRH